MHVQNPEIIRDDEIDLVALVVRLWEGKWIVALWVAAGVLLGSIFVSQRSALYEVTATVDIAQPQDLLPVQPSLIQVKGAHSVPQLTVESIYSSVLLQAPSLNMLQSFWGHSTQSQVDLSTDAAFRSFAKSFKLTSVNPKQPDITARYVSATFGDPELGAARLNAYLDFLNHNIQQQILASLKEGFRVSLKDIEVNTQIIEANGQQRLGYELERLNESLGVARALQIVDTPFKDLENIALKLLDGRDYLLGTKALTQQINTLTARQGKSMLPFDGKLIALQEAKSILEADLRRIEQFSGKIKFFRVESAAVATLDPKGPGSLLILIGLAMLCFLVGCVHVLVSVAIKNYRANSQS